MRFILSLLLFLTCLTTYGQDSPYSNHIYGGSSNGIVGKIDDEFNVTPNGQASYEIPIQTIPGTGGMAPKLSITYNSSPKDGLLGYGFDLTGLPVISRVPQNMHDDGKAGYVSFSSNDRFALDGNRLVLERFLGNSRYEYRTKINTYSKIIAEGDRYNPTSFTVCTKDGLVYEYKSDNYLLGQSSLNNSVFWFVTKVKDTKGNYFTVTYGGDTSDNDVYPTRIDYTGNDNASLSPYASVRISYTFNSYAPTTYIYGKAVRHGKHISSIGIYYGEVPVRNYIMQYQTVNYKKQLIKTVKDVKERLKKDGNDTDNTLDVIIRDYMCKEFFDIRTFGAVLTTMVKGALNCGQVRGPVQLSFAQSVDPIIVQEVSITRVAITTESDAENKKTEMGNKYIVPYGLYRCEGYVSANLANKATGFSEEDLELLWDAIINMFEYDHSAARGQMAVRKLVIFKHASELGNAPAHKLFDLVTAKKKEGIVVPRNYSDYEIIVKEEIIPDGVECEIRE